MNTLFDYPGNLGAVRGNLLTVLHADWPAYPQGDDFHQTLFQFATFPKSTGFVAIDDIDRVLLMMADAPGSRLNDPLNVRNFHIAAWHEDIATMQTQGFIEGVRSATEEEWQKARWDDLLSSVPEGSKIGFRDSDGNFVELQPPPLPNESEDDEYTPFVIVPSKRISVTDRGREHIYSFLRQEPLELAEEISPRVSELYHLQYYDTCVREACVQLEHEIKGLIDSRTWGDRLVEEFIKYMGEETKSLESSIRTYRQELRTIFKLIRNDYMHNLQEIDGLAAYCILFRISRARSVIKTMLES